MRIAVNTRFLLHNRLEGIGTFSHQVLQRLVRQHPEHEFIFIFDRKWHEEFIYAENVIPVQLFPQARHPLLFYWWFEWSVPKVLKQLKADFFFSPDGYLSLRAQIPQFPVFHDLAFEHYPEDVPGLASRHYRYYFPRYAKRAERLLTVSQFSKNDIVEQYGLAKDKIDVVYNAAGDHFAPINATEAKKVKEVLSNGKEYFLYVGALHQRKNITRLLKAYLKYLDYCHANQIVPKELLIVGRKAWGTQEMETVYEQNPALQEHVKFTGRLSDEELVRVTAAAYCHINVSYFEGFGIPILESLKCNVPVITSQNTPMAKMSGEAALLVDPFNTGEIADAMVSMEANPALRHERMAHCARIATQYSWQKTANLVWASFEKAGVLK